MNFDSPNQHCLDKLVRLSERQALVTTQDIYDDQGVKLWAKGSKVSQELQVRLLQRKLRAPLEISLTVEHALSFTELIEDCLEKLASDQILQKIAGSRLASILLKESKTLHLPQPLRLLMTSIRENDPESYERTLSVIVICASIATQLNTSQNDALALITSAALHDIGESYINPEHLHPGRRLTPSEWKFIASHPRIGQFLIRDLTSLHPTVALCVGQHHERQDGSGYPGQTLSSEQHHLSGWIAAADAAAAILSRDEEAAERIVLALRIIPEEFNRDVSNILIRAIHDPLNQYKETVDGECIERAQHLLARIFEVCQLLDRTESTSDAPSVRKICGNVLRLLNSIAKSMRASGVLDSQMLGESINDTQILAEMHLIVQEVEWRMRNLARNIYLRIENCDAPEALASLKNVIELLDVQGPIVEH